MPFVPLSQRKAVPLILDDEKVMMKERQQARDQRAVDTHFGVFPGQSGYRFANHPQTFGHVRGPDMPFRNATAPWRPPSADANGPAKQREREQASFGAYWEKSHCFRASKGSQSSPDLSKPPDNVMEACHPMSNELRRWEGMSRRLEAETRKDIELKAPSVPHNPVPPPMGRGGLVLFPKYMLINNCHLKFTELQRFQREQQEEARRSMAHQQARHGVAFEEQASGESASQDRSQQAGSGSGGHHQHQLPESPMGSAVETMAQSFRAPVKFDASWGAPILKEGGPQWAGNGLASGASQKTSNPFRMG